MNNTRGLFVILLLCVLIIGGCAAPIRLSGYETLSLPLNEGVKDLAFLSPGEIEILKEVNGARGTSAAGRLQPLKASTGLSLAARERARELAGSKGRNATEEEQDRLIGRVRKFGTFNGSVAEIASYGYHEGSVVEELMKGSSAVKERPQLHFMDEKYTVMGVGCTSATLFSPVCVITFASDFTETR